MLEVLVQKRKRKEEKYVIQHFISFHESYNLRNAGEVGFHIFIINMVIFFKVVVLARLCVLK
jgi:hypothetical protein